MKTVLITGAAGGIGEALCRYFEERDFKVLAHARSEAKAKSVTDGTQRVPVWGDLTRADDIKKIAKMARGVGPLDLLVHNAGMLSTDKTPGPNGVGINAEVNVIAPAKLTRELAPHLAKSDDPMVVIVSSTAANMARTCDYTVLEKPDGSGLFGHYALSKSAANALVLSLAEAFPKLTVLSTEPGFVKTGMTAGNDHMPLPMKLLANVIASSPEKAAHRCFDHILDERPESGSVVQSGKAVDSARKLWSSETALKALDALLAKADSALLKKS